MQRGKEFERPGAGLFTPPVHPVFQDGNHLPPTKFCQTLLSFLENGAGATLENGAHKNCRCNVKEPHVTPEHCVALTTT